MKKLGRILGIITLGMFLLAGCGDRQDADGDVWSEEMDEAGAESGWGSQEKNNQGQNSPEQSSQGQNSSEQNGGRVTLTLGMVGGMDWILQGALDIYNAESEKYYVEVVDYLPEQYDNMVYEAAEDRFLMDIGTGKGTDLIAFSSSMSADELGNAGILQNLNAFLTPEEKQEKYLGNILEAAQTGSALYEISPTFVLEFIVGNGSKIGMENGWTMEEMMESFERNGRDGTALAQGGVRTVARLVEYSIEDWVDWDTGTADFNNERFYRVLEFGRETDNGEFVRPSRDSVALGTHLANCGMLTTVASVQYLRWLYGDDMAVKGWPTSQGTGVAVRMDYSMGISSCSQCPEGAWDFLEFYVDADWVNKLESPIPRNFSNTYQTFALNKRLFEEMLEQSMEQEYYSDTGEPVPLSQGEGDIPDFYANTEEDVEELREIIALADRRSFSPLSAISQIIEEEISGYNAGALTAEQTAEKIQNRVQLYLDEQR